MPHVRFYPEDCTVVSQETVFGQSVPTGIADEHGLRLRRYGGDPTRFARDGRLFDRAVFTTIHIPMEGLTEVFGLLLTARWGNLELADAAVGLQISLNNGTSYLAWNGAAWAAQPVDGVYNTRGQLVDQLASLAVPRPGTLGFRIQLSRMGRAVSPVLTALEAHVEWKYEEEVDLHQTLRSLADKFRARAHVAFALDANSTTVILGDDTPADAALPIEVYNTTNDPARNTNLFQAYNPGTRVVTLTASQNAGTRLDVWYSARVPVHLFRSDPMVTLSALPALVVTVDLTQNGERTPAGYLYDYRIGDNVARVRVRHHPVVRTAQVEIAFLTRSKESALAASATIRGLLGTQFRLRATGQTPAVLEQTPANLDDMRTDDFYVGKWNGQLRFYAHSQDFREYPGMKRLDVNMGDHRTPWRTDDFSVR